MQNFMKTILSAVQTWTKGKIKDSTADWNQNDSNADNYVKNRTHWEEPITLEGEIFPLSTLNFELKTDWPFNRDTTVYAYCDTAYSYEDNSWVNTDNFGSVYKVYWDGAIYECEYHENYEIGILGNESIYRSNADNTGEPFVILVDPYYDSKGIYIGTLDISESHTIGIAEEISGGIHKIDEKYFPDNIATIDEVHDEVDVALQVAIDAATKANDAALVAQAKTHNIVADTSSRVDVNAICAEAKAAFENGEAVFLFDTYNKCVWTMCWADWNVHNRAFFYCIKTEDGITYIKTLKAVSSDNNGPGTWTITNVMPVSSPATAQVGQLLSVKAVDETGKPTEWETLDPATIFEEFGLTVDENGTLVGGTCSANIVTSVSDGQLRVEVV